jgi:K+-transporting ATPase ATPase B chain
VLRDAFRKLSPRRQVRSPVMFVVWIGACLTTVLGVQALFGPGDAPAGFTLAVAGWLWFTVLFANLAEASAEGGQGRRGPRRTRRDVPAKRLASPARDAAQTLVPAAELRKGDVVLVEPGDVLPCDGTVIEGVASVDESAVTGESAPVIRESGGDRSSVTGGTRLLSDWLVVEVRAYPGDTLLDRMIALVEGASRKKTPNEIALDILLAGLSIVFLVVVATLLPFSRFAVDAAGRGDVVSITVLVALLVCLIPTTIGGLLSAIGIAGMDRMVRKNVIATSGRAVEAAGDVDVLLLDKTGTITLGNRQAVAFLPAEGVTEEELAGSAASRSPQTPEGRSIVVSRSSGTASASGNRGSAPSSLHGPDAHERRHAEGEMRAPPTRWRRSSPPGAAASCGRVRRARGARRLDALVVATARAGHPRAARHRQGRHPRAVRRAAPDGIKT